MTTATIEVLANIRRQLDWRGPAQRSMAYVVLERADAEALYNRVLELLDLLKEEPSP
jgi:hypothetical protein